MQKYVSFDVDGTLVRYAFHEPVPSLFTRALARTFQKSEHINSKNTKFIPKSKIGNVFKSKDDYERFTNNFDKCFYEANNKLISLPGAKDILKRLKTYQNITLGISTGNSKNVALEKLRRTGLNSYFNKEIFGCSFNSKKEALSISLKNALKFKNIHNFDKMFHIGDTVDDIVSAIDMGFVAIAVRTPKKNIVFPKSAYVFDNLEDSEIINLITNS